MNRYIFGCLMFASGTAFGLAAGNLILKKKYEKIAQDEIDSVKEAFRKNQKPVSEGTEAVKPVSEERREYSKIISDLGYTEETVPKDIQAPYVISPDEFGENDEYEQISLTCYACGTLVDDDDRAMNDQEIAESVGKESLNHFGEYEEDSVYVRNDRLKVDYEILLDQRKYAEVLNEKPYLKHR